MADHRGAWVPVTEDPQRGGNGMLNLAVSDIEEGAREQRTPWWAVHLELRLSQVS
jgi:hypothetical protein